MFVMMLAVRLLRYGAHMVSLDHLEAMIAELSPAEKAQVLQWVARGLGGAFPGIERIPDVMGGEACIVRTRIPVWVLVQMRRLGASEADILRSYPTLRAADLVNAWAYAEWHSDELDKQIIENETSLCSPPPEAESHPAEGKSLLKQAREGAQ
jgi:uncharacterized protein (DUF433 family)